MTNNRLPLQFRNSNEGKAQPQKLPDWNGTGSAYQIFEGTNEFFTDKNFAWDRMHHMTVSPGFVEGGEECHALTESSIKKVVEALKLKKNEIDFARLSEYKFVILEIGPIREQPPNGEWKATSSCSSRLGDGVTKRMILRTWLPPNFASRSTQRMILAAINGNLNEETTKGVQKIG